VSPSVQNQYFFWKYQIHNCTQTITAPFTQLFDVSDHYSNWKHISTAMTDTEQSRRKPKQDIFAAQTTQHIFTPIWVRQNIICCSPWAIKKNNLIQTYANDISDNISETNTHFKTKQKTTQRELLTFIRSHKKQRRTFQLSCHLKTFQKTTQREPIRSQKKDNSNVQQISHSDSAIISIQPFQL
jgi:hypothetical protein